MTGAAGDIGAAIACALARRAPTWLFTTASLAVAYRAAAAVGFGREAAV